MHLNTQRGDLAAHVCAVGLRKRRQQINHVLRSSFSKRGAVNIARGQIEQGTYRLRDRFHAEQHAADIRMLDNRDGLAGRSACFGRLDAFTGKPDGFLGCRFGDLNALQAYI